MTLVAAYERLIGERGIELGEPIHASNAGAEIGASTAKPKRAERKKSTRTRHANRGKHRKRRHHAPEYEYRPRYDQVFQRDHAAR
jgi:hypothetical protein